MIRFTSVNTLYVQHEEAAKIELGRRERRRVDMLAARAAIAARQLSAAHGVAPEQHEQYLAYHRAQQTLLIQHDAALAAQDVAIAEARDALANAHRQLTTIVKLRERDRHADVKRDERREQRRNDDRTALIIALAGSSASPSSSVSKHARGAS